MLFLQRGIVDRIWRVKTSDADVYRRQILSTKVDPRAVGVKMAPSWHFGLRS